MAVIIPAGGCAACGGGTPATPPVDVEDLLLCDVVAGEVVGSAVAVYVYDEAGLPVGPPTFVVPGTNDPYVVQGVLQPCSAPPAPDTEFEDQLVCSTVGGVASLAFRREVQVDGVPTVTFLGLDGAVIVPDSWTPGPCAPVPPGLVLGQVCYEVPVPGQEFRGSLGSGNGGVQDNPGQVSFADFLGSGVDVVVSTDIGTNLNLGANNTTAATSPMTVTVAFSTPVHLQALSVGDLDASSESVLNFVPAYSGFTGSLQESGPGVLVSNINDGNPDGDILFADDLVSSLTFDTTGPPTGGKFLIDLAFAVPAPDPELRQAAVVKCDGCDSPVSYVDLETGLELVDPVFVSCEPVVVPETAQVYLDCASSPSGEFLGPELLPNGNMEGSTGFGAASDPTFGWTTQAVAADNIMVPPAAGQYSFVTNNFGENTNAHTGGMFDLYTPGGRALIYANDGSITRIMEFKAEMVQGRTYRFQADFAYMAEDVDANPVPFGGQFALINTADEFSPVAVLGGGIPNFMQPYESVFVWNYPTGLTTFYIGDSNDTMVAFDNVSLREYAPASGGSPTPVDYTETVKAVLEQVVQTNGCNDARRDNLLGEQVTTLKEISDKTRTAGLVLGQTCYEITPQVDSVTVFGLCGPANFQNVDGGAGDVQTFEAPSFAGSGRELVFVNSNGSGFSGNRIHLAEMSGTLTFDVPVENVTLRFEDLGTTGNEKLENISPAFTSLTGDGTATGGNTGVDPTQLDGNFEVTWTGPLTSISFDKTTDSGSGSALASITFDTIASDGETGVVSVVKCEGCPSEVTYVDLTTGLVVEEPTFIDCPGGDDPVVVPNPQIVSTVNRLNNEFFTVPAGARSVTVVVVAGVDPPTMGIGAGPSVILDTGVSLSWSVDQGGPSGETLLDEFNFVVGENDIVYVTTTKEA